jgi:anti-sigma B factor antagonist
VLSGTPNVSAVLFDVRVLQRGGWSVVAVVGDVDLATLPALRQGALGAGVDRVVLDLSGVDHFDPLGFGVVIALRLKVERQGGRFAVVCPPGRARDLFAESRVDAIVELVDSVDDLPGG